MLEIYICYISNEVKSADNEFFKETYTQLPTCMRVAYKLLNK